MDPSNARLHNLAITVRRTSYLAELESLYCYALRCKNMACGSQSPFFCLMQEYIELYYDKADVLMDLKPYLSLLNDRDDVITMRDMFRQKVLQTENQEDEPNMRVKADGNYAIKSHYRTQQEAEQQEKFVVSLKVLRWKFLQHKFMRTLGQYSHMEDNEKCDLVNRIFGCFLQAMEYHPLAKT